MRTALATLLLVLPVLPAAAGDPATWSAQATDAAGDADRMPMMYPIPFSPLALPASCPATDLLSGGVSFTGTSYVWTFTVADVAAPCRGNGVSGATRFPLYPHAGNIVADVMVFGDAYRVSYFDVETHMWRGWEGVGLFDGNTATLTFPASIHLAEENAFRMSAFVDNTVTGAGCFVVACVYTFRDEMST